MTTETPDQYTARLLGNVEGRDATDVLRTTAARIRSLITGRSHAALMHRPAPDRWSAGEIVTHLSDAEVVGAWRFRSVLASNAIPLQAYDQNAWAAAFHYESSDPFLSLEMFDALRRSTIALLGRVDRALYDNYGVHAERGHESIAHLIRLYAGHDINHLRQLELLLG